MDKKRCVKNLHVVKQDWLDADTVHIKWINENGYTLDEGDYKRVENNTVQCNNNNLISNNSVLTISMAQDKEYGVSYDLQNQEINVCHVC